MSPKISSSGSPRFCRSRLATNMQEGGPEAADGTITDGVRPPAAPHSCCRVPGPAQPQQQPGSAQTSSGQSRLFPCRNIIRASCRKWNHSTSRGQRLLRMQMSRKAARERQHRLSLPPLPRSGERNSPYLRCKPRDGNGVFC